MIRYVHPGWNFRRRWREWCWRERLIVSRTGYRVLLFAPKPQSLYVKRMWYGCRRRYMVTRTEWVYTGDSDRRHLFIYGVPWDEA